MTPAGGGKDENLVKRVHDLENKLAQAAQDEKEVGDGTAIR